MQPTFFSQITCEFEAKYMSSARGRLLSQLMGEGAYNRAANTELSQVSPIFQQ